MDNINTEYAENIADQLTSLADELGVKRNDHLSMVEVYASRANEGRMRLSDAVKAIQKSLGYAEHFDWTARILYDAAIAIKGINL